MRKIARPRAGPRMQPVCTAPGSTWLTATPRRIGLADNYADAVVATGDATDVAEEPRCSESFDRAAKPCLAGRS